MFRNCHWQRLETNETGRAPRSEARKGA
jgi:hypothetical protein